jgi:hypothetical protein
MSIFDNGFEFIDKERGKMLAITFGGEPWLFTQYLDGVHWVTCRKCTAADLNLLTKLMFSTNGPVLSKR